MTPTEFEPQFTRLEAAFRRPAETSRSQVFSEWFEALRHYDVQAVEHGVTEVIRSASDTYWPAVGSLRQTIAGRLSGLPRVRGKCEACQGSGWIATGPFKANGRVYDDAVRRCPDCGLPAPDYVPHADQTALTSAEYRAFMDARS